METNGGAVGGTEPSSTQTSAAGQAGSPGLIDRGKERVRTSVDESKTRVARTLSSVASSLKDSSTQMRDGDAAPVGDVVGRFADQIDRAADYIERSEVDEIVRGVEGFARRNPALFLGAAFAVGVLGARFLKSSRSNLVLYEGGTDAPGYLDREVPTSRVGAADLSTGAPATGTTGSADVTELE